METVRVQIDEVDFIYKKEKNIIEICASKHMVKNEYFKQILYSKAFEQYIMKSTCFYEEDKIVFQYNIPKGYQDPAFIARITRAEKLRFCMNLFLFYALFETRLIPVLHPKNLLVDYNLCPKMLYCGLQDSLVPFVWNEADFLLRYKALVIALFENFEKFDDYYASNLSVVKKDIFYEEIKKQNTVKELQLFLKTEYEKQIAEDRKAKQIVKRKTFTAYKIIAIAVSVLSAFLLIVTAYLSAWRVPYQERMLESVNAFLILDYDETIHILQNDNPEELPLQNKYMLATAYVHVEANSGYITSNQRDNILKNITLKTKEAYLEFWIYCGRGLFEKAMEKGQDLSDEELILFSLGKEYDYLKDTGYYRSTKYSGQDFETKLEELQNQIKNYDEKRDGLFHNEDSGVSKLDTSSQAVSSEAAASQEETETDDNASTESQE